MNTEIVQLSQIRVNDANPRTITDAKFHKLVNSILSFPKMLNIRPIAVDAFGVALGGNMRYRALTAISQMTEEEIQERLESIPSYKSKTEAEKELLISYWSKWQENPATEIIRADKLSDEEKREFVIKDNVGFGDWDWDMLANEWDNELLDDWGLTIFNTPMPDVDSFFADKDDSEEKDDKHKITLEYTEEECEQVREALSKIAKTPEQAVWQLLNFEE